jgi:hypothetical protein
MATSSLPPSDGWGPLQNWGAVEWLIGAAWTAGIFVATFVWRLSTRIALLEQKTEERHDQNRQGRDELLQELKALRSFMESEMRQSGARVDALYRLIARQKDQD